MRQRQYTWNKVSFGFPHNGATPIESLGESVEHQTGATAESAVTASLIIGCNNGQWTEGGTYMLIRELQTHGGFNSEAIESLIRNKESGQRIRKP
jgi:deferrochelatase/peroxidase EfeB